MKLSTTALALGLNIVCLWPAVAQPPPPPVGAGLKVNEVQASNHLTIADEGGQFNDWIEIYNTTAFELSLSSLYISDDPAVLTKYQLLDGPALIIPSHGYVLLWADDSVEQGILHLPFKLSSAGESVYLTSSDGTTVLDSVIFPLAVADQSWGRNGDGNAEWIQFPTPTPNASNLPQGIGEGTLATRLPCKPTMVSTQLEILETSAFQILSPDGRMVQHGQGPTVMDASQLRQGVYVLVCANGRAARFVKD